MRLHPVPVLVALTVVTSTGAALAALPLAGSGKLTVAPPAYFTGSSSADTVEGTSGNDVVQGRGGNDILRGLAGNDVVDGGTGNDRVHGGKGRDRVRGGAGNDFLYARDGERDVVDGGPGFDRAWVDRFDVVRRVERVFRR